MPNTYALVHRLLQNVMTLRLYVYTPISDRDQTQRFGKESQVSVLKSTSVMPIDIFDTTEKSLEMVKEFPLVTTLNLGIQVIIMV